MSANRKMSPRELISVGKSPPLQQSRVPTGQGTLNALPGLNHKDKEHQVHEAVIVSGFLCVSLCPLWLCGEWRSKTRGGDRFCLDVGGVLLGQRRDFRGFGNQREHQVFEREMLLDHAAGVEFPYRHRLFVIRARRELVPRECLWTWRLGGPGRSSSLSRPLAACNSEAEPQRLRTESRNSFKNFRGTGGRGVSRVLLVFPRESGCSLHPVAVSVIDAERPGCRPRLPGFRPPTSAVP